MRIMNIVISANEREVGSIIADLLDRKGVKIEEVKLVQELPHHVNKPKAAKNGEANPSGTTTTIEVINMLKTGKPVTAKMMSDRMGELGFAKTSQYSAIARFIKQGYAKKTAPGEFVATESGLRLWRAK